LHRDKSLLKILTLMPLLSVNQQFSLDDKANLWQGLQ